MFVACLFQHSCRGLAEHSPAAFGEGVTFKRGRRGGGRGAGKMLAHPPWEGGGGRERAGLQRVEGFFKVPNALRLDSLGEY